MSVKGFYINGEVQHYDYESLDNKPNDGLTEATKSAILQLARKVAYIDEHGEDYYQSLYASFYGNFVDVVSFLSGCSSSNTSTTTKEGAAYTATIYADSGYTLTGANVSIMMGGLDVTGAYSNGVINIPNVTGDLVITVTAMSAVSSISAVYTQGNRTVFSNDSLDSLKPYLVVTATYPDSTTAIVPEEDYALYGTLEADTSTITVSYGGKTATFDVTVTAFVIPEGYTRYDYIKKKSDSGSKHTFDNFIVLNSQEDMNSLSVEIYLARKNITANPGFLGARAVDYFPSVSFYCNDYLRFTIRGVQTATNIDLATDRATKVEIINPNSSPAYWRLNNGALHEIEWENSVVNPYGLCLFNNIPQEGLSSTAMWDICQSAIIGDIILRKADGECVGYYLPCVFSGKIGMYDIISETFYTAATAAAVTIRNNGCLYAVGNW